MFKKALAITIAIILLFVGFNFIFDIANLRDSWVLLAPVILLCMFYGFAKFCAWVLKIPKGKPIPNAPTLTGKEQEKAEKEEEMCAS